MSYPVWVSHGLDDRLAYPHYSDSRWDSPKLIWGKECETDNSNYSDRLWQGDYKKAEQASKVCVEANLNSNTARWMQTWLSAYHGRTVILRYVLAGSNRGNGYPYWFYGYDYAKEDE